MFGGGGERTPGPPSCFRFSRKTLRFGFNNPHFIRGGRRAKSSATGTIWNRRSRRRRAGRRKARPQRTVNRRRGRVTRVRPGLEVSSVDVGRTVSDGRHVRRRGEGTAAVGFLLFIFFFIFGRFWNWFCLKVGTNIVVVACERRLAPRRALSVRTRLEKPDASFGLQATEVTSPPARGGVRVFTRANGQRTRRRRSERTAGTRPRPAGRRRRRLLRFFTRTRRGRTLRWRLTVRGVTSSRFFVDEHWKPFLFFLRKRAAIPLEPRAGVRARDRRGRRRTAASRLDCRKQQ